MPDMFTFISPSRLMFDTIVAPRLPRLPLPRDDDHVVYIDGASALMPPLCAQFVESCCATPLIDLSSVDYVARRALMRVR